jgi:hypothetical protein
MTIAVSLKINDGIVLASDSASTLMNEQGELLNVYDNANKVFNLVKGLPIGVLTWGAGSIGRSSIATLVKDLRHVLTGDDPARADWKIDPSNYQLRDVAEKFRLFMFDGHYAREFGGWDQQPALGFMVAGYSSEGSFGEEYFVSTPDGGGPCEEIQPVRAGDEVGVSWSGQPEAISRLVEGISPMLGQVLATNLGVPPVEIPAALAVIKGQLTAAGIVQPAMPIQDAIDLAQFLVDLTINYVRFCVGAQTVGGPIEVAAITKHEGFKWVARKYYFSTDLNPEEGPAWIGRRSTP